MVNILWLVVRIKYNILCVHMSVLSICFSFLYCFGGRPPFLGYLPLAGSLPSSMYICSFFE